MDKIKFKRQVVPGDVKVRSRDYKEQRKFELICWAYVDGELYTSGTLHLQLTIVY